MNLSDASWIIPLLQAVERGEILQIYSNDEWLEMPEQPKR